VFFSAATAAAAVSVNESFRLVLCECFRALTHFTSPRAAKTLVYCAPAAVTGISDRARHVHFNVYRHDCQLDAAEILTLPARDK
jgi:hypothetical protein